MKTTSMNQVLMMKGIISQLSQEEQDEIHQKAAGIREIAKSNDFGLLALALIVAEEAEG